jgi:hypothetical protein
MGPTVGESCEVTREGCEARSLGQLAKSARILAGARDQRKV